MEIFKAHDQWAKRPKDEQFTSIRSLYDATKAYAATAGEKQVKIGTLRTEVHEGAVKIFGKGGQPASLTHWSFGQLAARVGAPAGYLRNLPATLAAQNLNHGLAKRLQDDGEAEVNLLFHANGNLLLRALTSDKYSRIWNWEVAERLLDLEAKGWTPATPDIRDRGDGRLPLYASDHDMFAFIMRPDRVIREHGNPEGLKRGLIASNSEVGAGKIRLMRFLYREMCGNHIIWGAENVYEMAAAHIGDVRGRFAKWQVEIAKYLDESASDQEAKIQAAQTRRIAGTKDELLDALFGKRLGISRKALEAGYDAVVPDEDGDPLTAWGMVQGLTRYSQQTPYADERMEIDKAAGKLLDAF